MCSCHCGCSKESPCACDLHCSCRQAGCGLLGLVQDMTLLQVALWDEHVFWTREVAALILAKLPQKALDAAVVHLLDNQVKISNTFASRFGPKVADGVHGLLKEHIVVAKELVEALGADKKAEVKRQQQRWNRNGQQIADALYGLNKELATREQWRHHLQRHLDITTQEAVAFKQGDYEASQVHFVEALNQARQMGMLIARLVS